MMDDVVGLVMVQVISNLGGDGFTPITVVRPVVVSIGLGVAVILACKFVAKPVTLWFNSSVETRATQGGPVTRLVGSTYAPVVTHTAILIGLVTGASYGGTSNLFAAYLAGASISWWDSEFREATPPVAPAITSAGDGNSTHTQSQDEASPTIASPNVDHQITAASESTIAPIHAPQTSGAKTFEHFYGPVLHRVFQPLFFASIGFAIPITKLFTEPIIWRGIIYTVLMLFGKLVTGLWLVRFPGPLCPKFFSFLSEIKDRIMMSDKSANKKAGHKVATSQAEGLGSVKGGVQLDNLSEHTPETSGTPPAPTTVNEGRRIVKVKHINRPLSLYPAALLGTAMTARGEIGFLIASLAETTGVFSSSSSSPSSSSTTTTTTSSSEIYLITTWAIVLCTIIGPLSVGTLVKRVRRLESDLVVAKGGGGGREEEEEEGPLGIWGVG